MPNSRYQTPDAVQHDARTLADEALALFQATADISDEKVAEARKRVEAALASGRDTLTQLQKRARESAAAADQAVRQHPYESIAVAFGVGALLGFLVTRRG